MDWTEGYVTELEYTHGYYRELCPAILRLACLSSGVAPPVRGSMRYLELGCGQGLSLNIHAAAIPGEFWGTDFNPTHVAQARALAEASGSGAILLDESFLEFASRPDLPEFDVIGLHGIWSWISDENSRVIVDLIRRKLRIGGIAYISYNCLPGWAPSIPLRHLIKLHVDLAAGSTGMRAKLDGALAFAKEVMDSGAFYFRGNPIPRELLKRMSAHDRNYLAHEYINEDWRIMAFSDVAKCLAEAKLTFVASADLMDHVEAINLTPQGYKFLGAIEHPILRQSVRDYLVNQQFRRDVFIKGPRRIPLLEQQEAFQSESFVLTSHVEEVPMKVKRALGEINLPEQVYRPLIEALAGDDYAPKSIAELLAHSRLRAIPLSQVLQAVFILIGGGHVHPAQTTAEHMRKHCRALNRQVCERARSGWDIHFLASPVTGGGVPVSRFHQLFLLALEHNRTSAAEQSDFAWSFLSAQRHSILKNGKPLDSAEEIMKDLTNTATDFAAKRFPLLNALGIS